MKTFVCGPHRFGRVPPRIVLSCPHCVQLAQRRRQEQTAEVEAEARETQIERRNRSSMRGAPLRRIVRKFTNSQTRERFELLECGHARLLTHGDHTPVRRHCLQCLKESGPAQGTDSNPNGGE